MFKDINKSNKENKLDKNLDNINSKLDKVTICRILEKTRNTNSNYIKKNLF